MEQSLENDNKINETCDIIMNEFVIEKNNVEEEFTINPNLQFEKNWKLKMNN
jgi:hypothetical protein